MQASQISSQEVRTRSMIEVRQLNMNKPHSDVTTTRQTTNGPRRTMCRSHFPPTSRRTTLPRQNNAPHPTGRTCVTQCRFNVQLSEALIVRRKSHFKWNCCTDFFCQLILVHNGLRQHFPEGVQNFVQWHVLKSNMAAATSLNH